MKPTVRIEFDTKEAALYFMRWLCGYGEHSYWDWMEYREQEEDGFITATSFDYWDGTGKGANFGQNLIIHTKCGRLDKR